MTIAAQKDLTEFCCQNPECPDFGEKGLGNLSDHGWSGKAYGAGGPARPGQHRWRMIRCRPSQAGRRDFSQRKPIPLFQCRLPFDKAVAAAKYLAEGDGIRKTSRPTGTRKNALHQLSPRLGIHGQAFHHEQVKDLRAREGQDDAAWSSVGKKDKYCDAANSDDEDKGSQWDPVILDAETKLVVSMVIGPRTEENTLRHVRDFAQRTNYRLPVLFASDEYPTYASALMEVCGQTTIRLPTGKRGGPKRPYKVVPLDLLYATVHKERQKGKVVKVTLVQVSGTPEQLEQALAQGAVSKQVNTMFVEPYHGTARQHNSRKARKAYTFFNALTDHEARSWFALTHDAFCRPHGSLKPRRADGTFQRCTSVMAHGLTGHVWSVERLLNYALPYSEVNSGR